MKTTSKIIAGIFVGLAAICLAAVCCGAWWHLFTAGICALMAWMFWADARRDERLAEMNSRITSHLREEGKLTHNNMV